MEGTIHVKENHQDGDSNLVLISTGSSIKIDSISINLVSNDETNAEKCEHFSIRGFVSVVRKKNWKLCSPFALDGAHNEPEEKTCALPPLHVAKFRWWRCQNCLREMGSQGNTYSCRNDSNYCCCTGSKSRGTCPRFPSLGDAAILPSDIQPDAKLNVPAGRKVDASIATDLKVNDQGLRSHDDKNGKKSEPTDTLVRVGVTCCEDKMNNEIPLSAAATTSVTTGLVTGRHHTVKLVSRKANCNGHFEFCKPGHERHDASDVELAIEKFKYMFKNSVEICQTGKQTSSEGKKEKLIIACGSSGVVGMVDEVLDAVKGLEIEHPSPESDDCDNPSSDSDETLSINESEDQHHDNSSGSNRRKTRKVRLLTELLAENGDAKANPTRAESFPSNSVANSPAGLDVLSDLQGHSIGPPHQHWKWKFLHDEERASLEISSPNNFLKKDRIYSESAEIATPFSCSDTTEDVGINPQLDVESYVTKFRFESPTDANNNKSLGSDGFLSFAPSKGYIPEDMGNNIGDANNVDPAGSILLKSAQTAFTGRRMYPFRLPPQKLERNSTIFKKKSKIPQFDEWKASLIPQSSGMLREGPERKKDVEIKHNHPINSPLQSSQGADTGKLLQLSLDSCLIRNDGNYFSLIEHSQFPWRDDSSKEYRLMGNENQTNFVGDFDYRSKCESDAFLLNGVCSDLSRESTGISFLNEKRKSTTHVDTGGQSLLQAQMDFASRGNNGKTTEKCCDRQADKVSEQAVSDDIPMEIVELMAKNQYERCLPDFGNDNSTGMATKTGKASVCTKGRLRFLSDENARKPKIQAKNGKSTRSVNEGTGKQKSVGCSLVQPDDPAHLMPITCCQEKRPYESSLKTTINNGSFPIYAKGRLRFLSDKSSRKPKIRANNGRNGKITRSENKGTSKRKSVDCSIFQPYEPAGFLPFSHCQEKPLNGIKISDRSCSNYHSSQKNLSWCGNKLDHENSQTNLQPLGSYNSCQNAPWNSKEAAHPLSSVIPSCVPFICDIPQKQVSESTKLDMVSYCPSLPKGNLSRIHTLLSFRNADVTNIEKHNRSFDSESHTRPLAEYPFGCKHSRSGHLDVYSNETISAMHLLSLMDAGLPSNGPVDTDGGNSMFLKRTSNAKDLCGFSCKGYKTTKATRPSPYECYCKHDLSENSRECFLAIQTTGASRFPFQLDKAVKKPTGFMGQAALNSQVRDKASTSHSRSQNKDIRSQQLVLMSGTSHGAIPVHEMRNKFISSSDSMVFPLTFHEREKAKLCKLESRNITSTVLPPKSSSKAEVCTINQNPADFSVPEAGNIYMIRGEDLKYRKTVFSKSRFKSNGRKRQKKLTATQAGKGRFSC